MLLNYAFKNFQSFLDRTEVSFVLTNRSKGENWTTRTSEDLRVSTAIAVFGANAAGKTALLKPLAFVDWFVDRSFSEQPDSRIPLDPHFSAADENTEIEYEAEDDEGVVWRYELELNPFKVIRENLYRKESRFRYVFLRSINEDGTYKVQQNGFGLPPKEAAKVRGNASLISTAVQYGVPVARKFKDVLTVATNVNYLGKRAFDHSQLDEACEIFSQFDQYRTKMIEMLREWDLGLTGIELLEKTEKSPRGVDKKTWAPFGIHKNRSGEEVKIRLEQESSGTQAAFCLLSRLLLVLDVGGVAVLDELESDLHPHLFTSILDLFDQPEINPNKAQIIFSCHSTNVLNRLAKSQVYLVEKNDCASEAFRADQIRGLRADDNLRAKYESGALGGVPRI